MNITEWHDIPVITYQKVEFLSCNKLALWAWLGRQYHVRNLYYEDTPTGGNFHLGFTRIDFDYSPEPTPEGRYKYVFDITELEGHSKIGEEFIATVRNTFGLSGEVAATKSEPIKKRIGTKSKYSSKEKDEVVKGWRAEMDKDYKETTLELYLIEKLKVDEYSFDGKPIFMVRSNFDGI